MLYDHVTGNIHSFDPNCHVELRAQINKTRRASMLSGSLIGNSRNEASGVCCRVYKNGFYGFASSAEYTDASCKAVLNAATSNADFLARHVFSDKPRIAPLASGEIRVSEDYSDPEQKYFIDFIKEVDSYVSSKYPSLISRIVSASAESYEKILAVADGYCTHSILPRSYIYVVMSAEDNGGQPIELYEVFGGFGSFDMNFTDSSALHDKIDRLYEHLCRKKEAVYASAGIKTCILGPMMSGMLAHEAVGHTVEADLVLGGSVAGPNLGKVVASDKVSLVDFAHTAFGKPAPLPIYVDDEGSKADDQLLIDRGVLVGFMNNRESALHFNMTPNGNARAYAFSDNLEDMIASIDDGYYLINSNNGQADTTGEFMFGVTLGYEIKNGKIGNAIKDTTISGVAFDMLKTVDMVSDEMEWSSSGFCGKKQPIPVGMGGPSIRCKVNVGGR